MLAVVIAVLLVTVVVAAKLLWSHVDSLVCSFSFPHFYSFNTPILPLFTCLKPILLPSAPLSTFLSYSLRLLGIVINFHFSLVEGKICKQNKRYY